MGISNGSGKSLLHRSVVGCNPIASQPGAAISANRHANNNYRNQISGFYASRGAATEL